MRRFGASAMQMILRGMQYAPESRRRKPSPATAAMRRILEEQS
jgi:hypothetical protein